MTIDIRAMAPPLQVFDMPTAIGFYRDRLAFEVLFSSGPGDGVDRVPPRAGGVERS